VEELSVVIGSSTVLHCPVTGIPEPLIRWTREGEPLSFITEPSLRVQNSGRELHVFNAQLLDIGSYACTASNAAGSATKEFLLNLLGRSTEFSPLIFLMT
jgi:hypothetical protein